MEVVLKELYIHIQIVVVTNLIKINKNNYLYITICYIGRYIKSITNKKERKL